MDHADLDTVIKSCRILLIDDAPAFLKSLEAALYQANYRNLISTTERSEVLDLYRELRPDLIILDLHASWEEGPGLLETLHSQIAEDDYVPILVLTGDVRPEPRLRALLLGAKDVVIKPFDPVELLLRVWVLLETRVKMRWMQRRIRQVGAKLLAQQIALDER